MFLYKKTIQALFVSAMLAYPSIALASNSYRVLATQGNVWAQYPGQSSYQRVTPGMLLPADTLLETGPNSSVEIECPNSSRWDMGENLISGIKQACLGTLGPDRGEVGLQTGNLLGGINPEIPYVTSPRRTSILSSDFTLRWNPVANASSYLVRVIGPEGEVWRKEVTGSEVQYTGDLLAPDRDYRVIVEATAIDGASSQLDQGAEKVDFRLLAPEHVLRINNEIARVNEQSLSTDERALKLADLYIQEDLLSDAIDILESVLSSANGNSETFRVLGDLYRYIGLNLLGTSRYEQAISIATQQNNIQEQANAKSGLAEIKVLLGKLDEAIQLLTEAQQAYDELSQTERSAELQRRLDELSSNL